LHKSGQFSRNGATAQSVAAFLAVFLCAFAPLREKRFRAVQLGRVFVQSLVDLKSQRWTGSVP
jgi:hypothetical protein